MDQYKIIDPITEDQEYIKKITTSIFGELKEEQFQSLFPLFEWIEINAGNQLIQQGEKSEHIYFLVYGRLTAISEDLKGDFQVLGEVAPGQAVGETGVIAEQARSAHVFAARDSVLIRLSRAMLYKLGMQYPQLILNLAKTVIRRTVDNKRKKRRASTTNIIFLSSTPFHGIDIFFNELMPILNEYGNASLINQKKILKELNISAEELNKLSGDHALKIRLDKLLDSIESTSQYVIYYADESEDLWINKAISQADLIYLLKSPQAQDELTPLENKLFSDDFRYKLTSKELVILHPDGNSRPRGTAKILKNRPVKLHHHIRLDTKRDLERIARFITGNTVGIALSGGGAKGLAHVGILLGLRKKGIPIDYYAGTSIGTFISSFGALDYSDDKMLSEGRILSKLAPTRRKNMNFFPFISLMKGKHLDKLLDEHFGQFNMEDCWINSACIASDMTEKKKVIIKSGSISEAIRASISLPGVFPPAVHGNSLYLDGGLMENLPIEPLENVGIDKLITVTLQSTKKYELNYDVVPDSWEYFKQKFVSKKSLKVPTITSIIMESMVLASYSKYNEATEKADLNLHPPVNKIGLLDWDAYEEMVEIGQKYAESRLTDNRIKQFRNSATGLN